MPLSPARQKLYRYQRARASSQAIARALSHAEPQTATDAQKKCLATLARRMSACAMSASFKLVTPVDEATFVEVRNRRACKNALCMSCARYRARNAVRKAMEQLTVIQAQHPDAPFAFMTLSSINRPMAEVATMLDDHEAAFNRFCRLRPIKNAVLGHITSFEIAIRGTAEHPEAGVHSHSLLVLHPAYFSKEHTLYIPQVELVSLWRTALRVAYNPICDIRRVRASDDQALPSALRETLKYAIAPHALFQHSDFGPNANPAVVAPLALALYKRRLVRSSGVFTQAAKILKQHAKEARHAQSD